MTTSVRVHSLGLNGTIVFIGLLTVLTVSVQTTLAQSYLLTLSQNQLFSPSNQQKDTNKEAVEIDNKFGENIFIQTDDHNSTIFVLKNTRTETPAELSQSAMDVITIIWYVATFMALAAFFLLMACSDRRCSNQRNNMNNTNETPLPPPTPSPSYSEFAPPSYETVMKTHHAAKTSIFVIPFSVESEVKESQNSSNSTNNNSDSVSNNNNTTIASSQTYSTPPTTPTTPIVNFYIINEFQKFSS